MIQDVTTKCDGMWKMWKRTYRRERVVGANRKMLPGATHVVY
jgi:hypothetical protein